MTDELKLTDASDSPEPVEQDQVAQQEAQDREDLQSRADSTARMTRLGAAGRRPLFRS